MVNVDFFKTLTAEFPDLDILNRRHWTELTTLGIGATPPLLVTPKENAELARLLAFLRDHDIPTFILGGGTNLVGSDSDDNIVAIKLGDAFSNIISIGPLADVGAGTTLSTFVETMAKKGFGGIAPLAGIPGTVGGAVALKGRAGHGMWNITYNVRSGSMTSP